MTGLTDEMRSDFKFMRALTDYIKLSAEEKMSHIKKGAELIQSKSKEYGFSLQTKDFPQCMGYVIKAPQI